MIQLVEVQDCTMPHFWYSDKIGQQFELIQEKELSFHVKHPIHSNHGLYILKEDAQIVVNG